MSFLGLGDDTDPGVADSEPGLVLDRIIAILCINLLRKLENGGCLPALELSCL